MFHPLQNRALQLGRQPTKVLGIAPHTYDQVSVPVGVLHHITQNRLIDDIDLQLHAPQREIAQNQVA